MLRSYILTALRHMRRHKLYTFINIVGLSIGFAAFVLVSVYTRHELSFDDFHAGSDRIVKINLEFGESADIIHPVSTTPNALMPAALANFPEVIQGTRYFNPSSFRPPVIQHQDKLLHEDGFAYADSTFFDVFSFPLIAGSPEKALAPANSVVLTRSAAIKYFNREDVLGEQLIIGGANYRVTGLMEDVPDNSHLRFTMLGSFSSHPASREEVWGSANYFTYLKLAEAADTDILAEKMLDLFREVGYDNPDQGFFVHPVPVRLSDIYLYSEADALSDPSYIIIFTIIGALILVIACINYMNLATARSSLRAREVGIRKVSGAFKGQLFGQFIAEAFVIAFLALALALIIVWFVLPYFNQVAGKQLSFSYVASPQVLLIAVGIMVVVALGSGAYPAVILASFRPVAVLKGQGAGSLKGATLRKLLVVGQFAVSIFLVIATLVVGEQLEFVQNKSLGYSDEAVIAVQVNRNLVSSSEVIKNALISSGHASLASFAGETPTEINGGYSIWGQGMEDDRTMGITAVAVDEDYLDVLEMDLAAGSFISRNDVQLARAEDSYYYFVLNESAVTALGWTPESSIGKRVVMNGRSGEIKGVVKDFHFNSLHQPIGPLALFPEQDWSYNCILVRISGDYSQALENLGAAWKQVVTDYPFQYTFLDDELGNMYKSERRLAVLFSAFSFIALVIACLGLFGMASFVTLQRTKEFGVRKVLGASARDIVGLITGQFALLIIIAFVIAAPVSYYIMEKWLANFVYRMEMSVAHFMLALGGALVVAIATISFHAFRSAATNPASVLKNE